MIAFGTFYFGAMESCSCGFGKMRIKECIPDKCEETGGTLKSFIDTFYMSCITLTTVGFGDYSPTSQLGRLLAIPWMICGIGAVGDFSAAFGKYFLDEGLQPIDLSALKSALKKGDDGTLSKLEFIVFMLVSNGIADWGLIDTLEKEFDKMDAMSASGPDGSVTLDEAATFQQRLTELKRQRG